MVVLCFICSFDVVVEGHGYGSYLRHHLVSPHISDVFSGRDRWCGRWPTPQFHDACVLTLQAQGSKHPHTAFTMLRKSANKSRGLWSGEMPLCLGIHTCS